MVTPTKDNGSMINGMAMVPKSLQTEPALRVISKKTRGMVKVLSLLPTWAA